MGKKIQMTPFLFYDFAALTIQEPLPGQNNSISLSGTGAGIRGAIAKSLEYELDWSVALRATDQTVKHDQRSYFKVRAVF
jgi:hemolysin activation/secretion protein